MAHPLYTYAYILIVIFMFTEICVSNIRGTNFPALMYTDFLNRNIVTNMQNLYGPLVSNQSLSHIAKGTFSAYIIKELGVEMPVITSELLHTFRVN